MLGQVRKEKDETVNALHESQRQVDRLKAGSEKMVEVVRQKSVTIGDLEAAVTRLEEKAATSKTH